MSFTFRVEGSLYSLVSEMREIELKAHEEGISEGLQIAKESLLAPEPYILVTCADEQKGKRLFERVRREAPHFKP